jgi:hypothetical protein
MYKIFITFLFFTLILCLTPGAFAAGFDSSNFSSDGRKLQPVPSGHVPGKDNGPQGHIMQVRR